MTTRISRITSINGKNHRSPMLKNMKNFRSRNNLSRKTRTNSIQGSWLVTQKNLKKNPINLPHISTFMNKSKILVFPVTILLVMMIAQRSANHHKTSQVSSKVIPEQEELHFFKHFKKQVRETPEATNSKSLTEKIQNKKKVPPFSILKNRMSHQIETGKLSEQPTSQSYRKMKRKTSPQPPTRMTFKE
jgi:hypothetical protein